MPPRRPSPIGCHIPLSGNPSGLTYATRVGAEAIQIFASNPRSWATPRPTPAADKAFAERCAEAKLPVFVHAPYLVDLGSSKPEIAKNSAAALTHALRHGTALGARGVIVHAGATIEPEVRDTRIAAMRDLLRPILDAAGDDAPALLLEPAAGGGYPIAATIDELGALFSALDDHPRLGVCLDTCHAFAAGHDLAVPGGIRKTLNALVRVIGRGRLNLVHANDSKDPLGSNRDRHAAIGAGSIGEDPFAELFRHPATRGVPVIVETPGGIAGQRRDIALLKAMRDSQ